MKKYLVILLFVLSPCIIMAQFDNLEKEIKREINRRVERKVDKTIENSLDRTEEAIEGAVTGSKTNKRKATEEKESSLLDEIIDEPVNTDQSQQQKAQTNKPKPVLKNNQFAYSTKYDFTPGNSVVLFEDFRNANTGDFPSKWNTNGTGEIVESGNSNNKWLKLHSSSVYIPDLTSSLAGDFTIEFDIATEGLTDATSSNSNISIHLDDNNTFNPGNSYGKTSIFFYQRQPKDIHVESKVDKTDGIKNTIQADIRQVLLQKSHISIAVNNQRFRMWVNETKYCDIPRFLKENESWFLKFSLKSLNVERGENVFISNIKITQGSHDIQKKLLTDGKVASNGVLFPFDSDKVKPESYGVLNNVAQTLKSNPDMKLKIVGHTDNEGIGLSNLELSMRRAESVKSILVQDFNIEEFRLETEGKGESQPIVENDTPAHKAENRRVEFIKM
jgi:outer membrane protein OmpA-like peptidoglycan-associated protein